MSASTKIHCIAFASALLIVQVLSQGFGQTDYLRNSYNTAQNQRSNFNCPEKNGTFATGTCDGYIECKDGVAEEQLCPDGLLFNPEARGFPCQYPIDVDCTGRTATQPPQATDDCPHQYGYFRVGDANNCGQFMNCAAGRGYKFDCPEGLAFNRETYMCEWPDQVPDCDSAAYLGFTCPPQAKGFFSQEFTYFRSPHDCQKYFLCIQGNPRLYNCGEGRAYNELTSECDGAENVTGCAPAYNPDYDVGAKRNTQHRG